MDFRPLPFSDMNESEVRTAVVDPLLAHLGYKIGGENGILQERELELRYPFIWLGRKKRGKDPALKGKPDYICEVRGFGRWTVEAKPPNVDISSHDIEQAHSYANHGEVQAPLYVICNGRTTMVFETNRLPIGEPILVVPYEQLPIYLYAIENLLSPERVKRRYQTKEIDLGRALAPGFRSSARILTGTTTIKNVEYHVENAPVDVPDSELNPFKQMIGLNFAIHGDRVYRAERNAICADVRGLMPTTLMGDFAKVLDVEMVTYTCHDETVSMSEEAPSIFQARRESFLAKGARSPASIFGGDEVILPVGIKFVMLLEARCFLKGYQLLGEYRTLTISTCEPPINMSIINFVSGDLTIQVDD